MSQLLRNALVLSVLAFSNPVASAQDLELDDPLGLGGQFGPKSAEVTAELVAGKLETGATAYLRIHVLLPLDHYIYSMNPDFSGCTAIALGKIEGLEPIGSGFKPTRKPKVVFEEVMKQNVEKFFDDITWVQRFRVTDAAAASVAGELTGQYCTAGKDGQGGNCTPIRPAATFTVALALDEELANMPDEVAAPVFEYTEQPTRGKADTPDPLSLKFSMNPAGAKVGDEVTLQVAMTLDDGWHTFGQNQNPANTGLPTVLKVSGLAGLDPMGSGFVPNHEPEVADPLKDGKTQLLFHDTVIWSRKFRVVDEQFAAEGSIRYQACKNACLPPHTIEFALGNPDLTMVAFSGDTGAAATVEGAEPASEEPAAGSLPLYLLYAFLGGLILNVMPCVLPVLAIKILSFAKQAGESRGRVLLLNFAYSFGVIFVFLGLAALAVGLSVSGQKMGWGQLFQMSEFNLVMAGVIFVMGLSLLGVFEIPIPGMGGGESKEGPLGAFLTGIMATLLATPCSGPFMGVTLAWSVKQPPTVTFLVWGIMGLGMASPYILFAIVPGAVKILPKPGMWMVRFKEIAGFVLLATVIYFVTFLEERFIVPLLIGLLAIGFSLWMIGTLYQHNSPLSKKWKVRIVSLAMCGLGMFVAYRFTEPASAAGGGTELVIPDDGKTLPWQAFSEKRLMSLMAEKKTVMIDFTADWCLICKLNEKTALNTPETLALVKQHDIVPLYADYTRTNAEIKKWLDTFNSISVPLTVIFPNGDIDNPIVLRDKISKAQLLSELEKAVGDSVAQGN